MAKRYPMANNFLLYKKINDKQYKVTDYITEKEFVLDRSTAAFLKKLDGKTDPYSIECRIDRREVKDTLAQLDKAGLLRHSMTLIDGFGTYYRTCPLPHRFQCKP